MNVLKLELLYLSRALVIRSHSCVFINKYSTAISCHPICSGHKSIFLSSFTRRSENPPFLGSQFLRFSRRHISSEAINVKDGNSLLSTSNPGYIIPPPAVPQTSHIPPQVDITDSLNSLGEPTLSSLGLCNWTPAGFIQQSLEILHVNLDLPWWSAIVVGTICIRILIFPLMVKIRRNLIEYTNHAPELYKLQLSFMDARNNGNRDEILQRQHEIVDFMDKNKLHPQTMMFWPFVQAPIFLSVYYGIRGMVEAPVESMADGGLLWWIDLTVADPYFVLPAMVSATLLLVLEVGAEGVKVNDVSRNTRIFFRCIPFIVFPFVAYFPSAMVLYWATSNIMSLIQVCIFKTPSIKKLLNIPNEVEHSSEFTELKTLAFKRSIKEVSKNNELLARLLDRENVQDMKKLLKDPSDTRTKHSEEYSPTKPSLEFKNKIKKSL